MTKKTDDTTAGGTTNGATAETNIVVLVEHEPQIVLLDENKAELLFAHIQAEVEAFEPDMTTAKGRDACRALAAKVTKTKTTVDAARLKLTEDARAKIKIVNESGAKIKERLVALADRARAPLTAWEAAEDARQETCKAMLEMLRQAAIVPLEATSETLKLRISEVEAVSMDEEMWQGMMEIATKGKETALEALRAALAIVEQKEKDAAELAALRAAAEERAAEEEAKRQRNAYIDSIIEHITQCGNGFIGDQPQPYGLLLHELEEKVVPEIEGFGERRDEVERHRVATLERIKEIMEKRAARRAAEEADAEARAAEERRAAEKQQQATEAERAEQQRIASEQAATAAAERAREEEAARAAEQAAETQRAHDEALAVERRAREEAEERERQRVVAEEAAAAERARLEADQARRRKVKTEAKNAIMSCGANEDTAQKIVLAIIAGEIPRIVLDFSARGLDETKPEGALL